MGVPEIEAFSTYLAVDQNVVASTQNQALSALSFRYRNVLSKQLDRTIDAVQAKKPKRLPAVLSKEEAHKVIGFPSGTHKSAAKHAYGCGLRLMECLLLRVKDLDFSQQQTVVRDGRDQKDRVTMLPENLAPLLRGALASRQAYSYRRSIQGV